MEKYELQKLRDLPIEGVAERLGLQVTRHKCLCPFHDDHHASMSFKVSKNTCRCFVCMTQSIGPIDLVMRYLNKPFREACQWLQTLPSAPLCREGNGYSCNGIYSSPYREGSGVGLFDASRYERYFEHPFLNDEARRFLFNERRLDPRVVRWCRLTSWKDRQGVPWLQIPYYNQEAMWHLQPARAQPPAPGRHALHHRRLLRLLGDALCRSQGHRHPLRHAAHPRGQRKTLNSKL